MADVVVGQRLKELSAERGAHQHGYDLLLILL